MKVHFGFPQIPFWSLTCSPMNQPSFVDSFYFSMSKNFDTNIIKLFFKKTNFSFNLYGF